MVKQCPSCVVVLLCCVVVVLCCDCVVVVVVLKAAVATHFDFELNSQPSNNDATTHSDIAGITIHMCSDTATWPRV